MKTIKPRANLKLIKNFFLILCLPLLLNLTSCQAIKMVKRMNETEVDLHTISNGKQTVQFIPMIHIAKPEFYENVKASIGEAKKEGYVLYYEWIDFDDASLETKLKIREMVGLIPSPEGYANVLAPLVENGYVVQTEEMFLGIVNNKDENTDIDATELVNTYEKRYGEISITDENRNLPLTEQYKATQSKKDVHAILLDYRNEHLVDEILKRADEKVIVIYGAEHQKGIFKLLQESDASWEEK